MRNIDRKARRMLAAVGLLGTLGVLPGCGGTTDTVSAPPKIDAPPPAVSADAQKKYEKAVPNAGMSSSSGAADSLAP
jgi:hypothetical protein